MEKELGIISKEDLLKGQAIRDRSMKTYIKFNKTGGFNADDASGFKNTGLIKGTDIYQWEKGKYGNSVPKVDAEKALKMYRKFQEATDRRLIASALSKRLALCGSESARDRSVVKIRTGLGCESAHGLPDCGR